MDDKIILAPASAKQEMFLNSNATVTLCGGAAGSGKTFVLLMIALKFMQHPKATGAIFRKTSKQLTSPGSIWQEAVSMYKAMYPKGLKVRYKDTEIVFPNGAVLKFSHMQHTSDMYSWKGSQLSFVAFDECTEFEEEAVVYLMSRMRNAHVNYSPQMFLLTNPDYNSFLREWIENYYLDPLTGIPLPDKCGVKRYFFRQGNTMLWYNSLEEAENVHGVGSKSGITSFTFIPANCYDNPPLLKAQPDYISRLMSLPRVEMERLLLGSWYARAESSGLFKRDWVTLVDFADSFATKRVRAWDLAFSLPSEQYPNPDWTRGVLMSRNNKTNTYRVEDVQSARERVHDVETLIFETAEMDGRETIISIPIDPNAAAGAYAKDLQRRLSEKGFICKLQKPVKSKVTRFAPFSAIAESGFVEVVRGHWNREFFDELEIFDGSKKNKDDQVDCISDAFAVLNKELVLPTFSLANLSHGSPNAIQGLMSGLTIPISGMTL